MKILHRYIIKETFPPFFLSLFVFLFILLINLLFEIAELIVEKGFTVNSVLLFFLTSFPSLLAYTIPIAFLCGVLIGISRLSSDREIIAIRTSGIKASTLLFPLILFSLFLSLLLLYINFYIIPIFSSIQNELLEKNISSNVLKHSLKPKEFFNEIEKTIIYTDSYDIKKDSFEKLIIYQNPKEGEEILITAKEGKILDREPPSFYLKDGLIIKFKNKRPGDIDRTTFKENVITFEFQKEIKKSEKADLVPMKADSLFEKAFLKEKNSELKAPFQYEFFRRIANSIIVFVFLFIAFPLGNAEMGKGKGAHFTISIIIVLFYWIIQSALGNLSLRGKISPFLGAFIPPITFLIISIPLNGKGGEKIILLKDKILKTIIFSKIMKLEPTKESLENFYSFFRIKILDKYVSKITLKFFLITLSSLIILDYIVETRGLLGYITSGEKLKIFFKYLFFRGVGLIPTLTPFAFLIGLLISCAIMERRNEIIAIKSSGISIYSLSKVFLSVALLVSVTVLILLESIIPYSNDKGVKLKDKLKNYYSRQMSSVGDIWLFDFKSKTIYNYKYFDRKEKIFQGLTIYYLEDDFSLKERFKAKSSTFDEDNSTIIFSEGWWWKEKNDEKFNYLKNGKLKLNIKKDFLVLPENLDSQVLNSRKLKKVIKSLKEKGLKTRRLQVEYFRKFIEPFNTFVLVIIGLPFAFKSGRKGSLYGLFIAIALSILYMVMVAFFKSIAQVEWLNPLWATLFPPLIFTISGTMLLLKAET